MIISCVVISMFYKFVVPFLVTSLTFITLNCSASPGWGTKISSVKTNKQWRIRPTRWHHCVFLSASTIELSSVELYQGSLSPYCQINQSTWHHWTAFIYLFITPLGSKSQSALWNAITAGMGIKGKEQKPLLNDPRSLEEILAEDFPLTDEPDATEKTAIRFACGRLLQHLKILVLFSIME